MTKITDELISRMFPEKTYTYDELEAKYPKRDLPINAIVTRFSPSPTGFLHIGGIYIAMIAKDLAYNSKGVYFVRVEDTDQERLVEDSKEHFEKAFKYFDISSDEDENAPWGPYVQSERSDIYISYVKHLVQIGRAYPCFCTKETLQKQSIKQSDEKVDRGYYGRWAKCRNLDSSEVERKIKLGEPYVIRFKSNGSSESVTFDDKIRNKLTLKDNINDVVILKSSSNKLRLPTYHLAHAVDDHLMRVNLVLRSEEWLPSVPLHLQLFDALGFERISYAHIAPLMKLDGASKRKLSKRKDPEASVNFYMEQGYPAKSVIIYLRGLANSNLAELPISDCLNEPIILNNFQHSGALVDFEKLNNISSNYIAKMEAGEILNKIYIWANEYDTELALIIKNKWNYTLEVIDTDRFPDETVRKDLYQWSQFRNLYGFFYAEIFEANESIYEKVEDIATKEVRNKLINNIINGLVMIDDKKAWFNNLKDIIKKSNFALNNKEYKKNPTQFVGKMKDAISIFRIILTGKVSGLGLYEICRTLGNDEVDRRLKLFIED